MAARPQLFVGNYNYSSWSLRPWLVLRWGGIEFDERYVELNAPGYGKGQIADVLAVSPSGRVPALHVGELQLWDSLAISEWAAEQRPELWPAEAEARAIARAATCEMHAGFSCIRNEMPMNLRRRVRVQVWPEATQREVDRVVALWRGLRRRFEGKGPWLMGKRSIVDAFYAPVVTRFRTYGVDLDAQLQAYAETLLADADFLDWEARPMGPRFEAIESLYR